VAKRKVKIDRAALKAHLGEQVAFLRSSCAAFDRGDLKEAKRIATALRVLLHNPPGGRNPSRSLLSQYGTAFSWRFADSAFPFNPRNALNHHGLVSIRLETTETGGSARFAPLCETLRAGTIGAVYPSVAFHAWWSMAIVFKDSPGETFTRSAIVRTMADQDGGAHVDGELDASYAALTKENSLGWKLHVGEQPAPWDTNPAPASVRQIAHEVLVTLAAAELIERVNTD
jgi:hypothetical protein